MGQKANLLCVVIVLAAIAVDARSASAEPPERGSVSGSVGSAGGNSLAWATVVVFEAKTSKHNVTLTNKHGRFLITDLPAGQYRLCVYYQESRTCDPSIEIVGGSATIVQPTINNAALAEVDSDSSEASGVAFSFSERTTDSQYVPDGVMGDEPFPLASVVDESTPTNATFFTLGAGVGGLVIRNHGSSNLGAIGGLRVGLGRGSWHLGLEASGSTRIGEGIVSPTQPDGSEAVVDSVAVYPAAAVVRRTFLERSRLRPTLGLGLESMVVVPAFADNELNLSALGRVGVELEIPATLGTLAVGVEVTGHLPLAESGTSSNIGVLANFSSFIDLRF